MMAKITTDSLLSLETYHKSRPQIRERIIGLRKRRTVHLGEHLTLIFENEELMRYQVQEMLRVERIFESAEIADELSAYNPLIPDGTNWKGTFMFEYPDVEQRRRALGRMAGIEHRIWLQVATQGKIFAIANEDLDRSTDEKTSAVHFLRFELDPDSIAAVKGGADIKMGIDHQAMTCEVTLPDATRRSLLQDLD